MEPIRIGSQLFINPSDSVQRVQELVGKMHENGLRLIRLFMLWEQLEPQKGKWDFSRYDACFDAAMQYEMQVIPTLMAVSPPGWMRLTNGPQSIADLDDPVFWKGPAYEYVRKVVSRYADHPAVHSWILWNEPSRVPPDTPFARQAFRRFLEKKYKGDIDRLNAVYYAQAEDFSQVEPRPLHGAAFESYAQRLDSLWAAVDNLDEKIRELGQWVREFDPVHPIHVNPHNVGQNMLPAGQSVWHQAEYTDFLGCSAHVPWHSGRFPADRRAQSIALYADMMRSATSHPEGMFWVTELQGGPTWFSSPAATCPSGEEIAFWIWEAIGSGARAVLFWCFGCREGGDEAGEWNLLNLLDEPSERLDAARKAADILSCSPLLFDSSRPADPEVLILDSENTEALCAIETTETEKDKPRNRNMASDALCGAWLLCSDLGLSIAMVSEERFWKNQYPASAKILILPETTALDERTIDGLLQFRQRGGTVIADGLCGLKDPLGNLARERAGKLKILFGMQAAEIRGLEKTEPVSFKDGKTFPSWFTRVDARLAGGQADALFGNGMPAVVRTENGTGTGIRILTSFFRQAMLDTLAGGAEILRALLPEDAFQQRAALLNSSRSLRLRRLNCQGGEILILMNTGRANTAVLRFSDNGALHRLDAQECYSPDRESLFAFPLKERSMAVFYWERQQEGGEII